jgi:hypothetical protein
MSAHHNRLENKFSATTSCFLLPTFRRPCYLDIIKMSVNYQSIDTSNIFHQWTLEGHASIYKKINDALLSDDYDILKVNMIYINNLRHAIKENLQEKPIKVYRNLKLDPTYVRNEYKENQMFLWPTFSSTSSNKDIASRFGNYTFEINALLNDFTYRADVSKYSQYPYEQEILFYPYSGFRVKGIFSDARIIQLECVDTLEVESYSKELIPEQVKLYDKNRQMFVYLYKNNEDLHWSTVDQPDRLYLIGQNTNGYWDSHYRYHHRNGYFLHRGNSVWEEYQNNKYHASFQQI